MKENECQVVYGEVINDIGERNESFNKNTNILNIDVKYHNPDLIPINFSENGDWIDLRAAEEYHLYPNKFVLINLGISMKLPEGYEAHIVPRSSTFKNWGLIQTNGIGIIDNSYCGENDIWMMPVITTKIANINVNDRVCQFRIVKKMPDNIKINTVDHLESPNRGGFGSSGVQ